MIRKANRMMEEKDIQLPGGLFLVSCPILVEHFLDIFEELGMLPPNNGTYNPHRHNDEFLYMEEVYDWEPEDEEI
jgi:hypothetical protein